ncbi:MAG: PspC domain-containing protein [Chloroflexi bacterium]|nr:PspC domain-containing protein [Chloroflexota bacterium]
MTKRLYRSRTNRMIWGVCSGLAEYFDIDPTIIRIIFVLLVFAGGLGLIAYIVMAIIVPLEGSEATTPRETVRENIQDMAQTTTEMGRDIQTAFEKRDRKGGEPKEGEAERLRYRRLTTLAIVLIIIGLFFLLNNFGIFGIFGWSNLWPIILIIIGLLIIINARRS